MSDTTPPLIKVVIVGPTSSGKTSLLHRYINQSFSTEFKQTIGVEFCVRQITLQNETTVKLQIWDTSGVERYRNIITAYFRGAACFLLCVDLTQTEDAIKNAITTFYQEIASSADHPLPPVVLVGTKNDLQDPSATSVDLTQLAVEYGKQYGNICQAVITSAKDNQNIDQAFQTAAELGFERTPHFQQRGPSPHTKKPNSKKMSQQDKKAYVHTVISALKMNNTVVNSLKELEQTWKLPQAVEVACKHLRPTDLDTILKDADFNNVSLEMKKNVQYHMYQQWIKNVDESATRWVIGIGICTLGYGFGIGLLILWGTGLLKDMKEAFKQKNPCYLATLEIDNDKQLEQMKQIQRRLKQAPLHQKDRQSDDSTLFDKQKNPRLKTLKLELKEQYSFGASKFLLIGHPDKIARQGILRDYATTSVASDEEIQDELNNTRPAPIENKL